MNTKKLVAMLLTLAMVLTCLSVTAFAETQELTVGENPVTVPAGEEDYFRTAYFTPELSGNYLIDVDWEEPALCWVDAETISDGEYDYYVLEAGVTYEVTVVNMDEVEAEYIVYIEYIEDLEILEPVAMEITKLPDNTTYLFNDGYEVVLDGLEMEVTWSDGSVTAWSFNDEGAWLGSYYLDWEIVEGADDAEIVLSVPELELAPVSFEVTLLDLMPVSIELVDSTPVTYIENSCGIDMSALGLDMGWYYLALLGTDREVVITFSDGSTVNGVPGDVIYGFEICVLDSQTDAPWTKDNAYIEYSYADVSTELQVQLVESPVESVELLTPPTNNVLMLDEEFNMVDADGDFIETTKQLLEGMSLQVNYKDGSAKTFETDDIDWVDYEGMDVPFVDGYPVDILSAFLGMLDEEAVPPCDLELTLGYMGADFSYTLSIVEEFPEEPPVEEPTDEPTDEPEAPQKPDVEQIPETGDEMTVMLVMIAAMAIMGVALVTKKKMM